tara:strand:+ start:131 stop:1687 length:1557 start_codon:yes stop_codon:yes gene_type:complete
MNQAPQQEMGLFNYNVDMSPMVMDIRSETLEPISQSAKRKVFRLDSAGYLDQNSVLLFKLTTQQGNNQLRVNPSSGALLGIKRATLQIGDHILNDSVDIGRVSALTNLMGQNEATRNQYAGHYYGNQFHSKVNAGYDNTVSQQGGKGTIIYDTRKSGVDYGSIVNQANAQINSIPLKSLVNDSYQYGIPLGVILPCLKNRSIPLFLFQEYRILITIEFEDEPNYISDITMNSAQVPANNNTVNRGMAGQVGAVSVEDVKLQVDYIIYPSEIQAQAREQTNAQGGYRLDFFDIIKVEKNIPQATANQEQSVEHRIGADNKEVHKIYMMKKFTNATYNSSVSVGAGTTANFGRPIQPDRLYLNGRCQGINQEEYNVNIDGVDVFVENKWNPSSQYDETTNCLGQDLKVVRPSFWCDENTINCRLGEPNDGILGKYKPLCLDLTNGEPVIVGGGRQIGAYPIIWKYKRKAVPYIPNPAGTNPTGDIVYDMTQPLEVDYFMYVSRVANVKSTPQGTQVVVSY